MNAGKKNISNGWILCPSKSFPGKFYYFNVLNGEAAWSLSEPEKKGFVKQIAPQVQKIVDKSHEYPEPTNLPDENSITASDISAHVTKPDYLRNQSLPTFGQLAFPKYVANNPTLMPNIVWAPLQLPTFCPENKRPMSDKDTQTEIELSVQTCNVPLCKRFKNYEKPILCFDKRNKILNKPKKFETSTPKSSFEKHESQNSVAKSKSFIKESTLKFDSKLPKVGWEATELSQDSQFESAPEVERKSGKNMKNLTQIDLRLHLQANKRKSMDASLETIESKKLKSSEFEPTSKKKVSFDFGLETGEGLVLSDISSQDDFQPSSPFIGPKSPILNQPFTKEAEIPKVATSSLAKDLGLPVRKNNWYIVADTDILLLDYELIDNLVLSDPKCKLIIPHAVRVDIESLCIGDCHGQQRVIQARQIARKLATPPPHYTVEPPPIDKKDEIIVTTDCILNCCLHAKNQNYYVVLISNDPHLQVRANSLDIPSYKINDIKNGADIKPEVASQAKNINSQTKAKLGLFPNLSSVDSVKKQLSFNDDSDDKLINITKPKFFHTDDSDSDSFTSDISREVQNLNIIDKNVMKPQSSYRNPFLLQNVKEAFNFGNTSNIFDSYIFDKTSQNSKNFDFEKTLPKSNQCENYQNTENLFLSKPVSTSDQFIFNNKNKNDNFDNPGTSLNISATNTRKKNPSQSRIDKIFENIKLNTETNNPTKEFDNSGIFKVPQPLQFKIRRNTSAPVESSSSNDKIRTPIDKDSIEENVKKFCVKSSAMREKISTRIEEWICCFIQIMEDVLSNLLLKSSVCMEDTLAPLNLHDILNYVKMSYDCQSKATVIDKLSEMLDKCTACKGKFKAFISPEFFMKMFRYGVMLISTLKVILPNSEELNDAELSLNDLLSNIESNANEIDLESLRTPSVSRADTDDRVKVVFTKEKSYVLDYLKKHFKEWASYKEECVEKDLNTQEINHPDLQVVRTSGKNLNLVKIISNKAICLQNPTESDAANDKNQSNDIRLLDNRQLNESYSNLAITEPKLMELCEHNSENISKINYENNLHSKDTKEIEKNYTTPTKSVCIENTDLSNPATEIDEPKMVRNTTTIDEYEKKVQNREPLDMDLLDYSEIYEPSVAENPEFDIIEEKQINNNNHFENYNNVFTENVTENVPLETIFQTDDNLDNIFNTNDDRKTENKVEHTLPTKSGNEHSSETGNAVQNIDEKTINDNSTDKNLPNNDCCADNPEIGTASNDGCVDNPEIGTASNDCCVDNPETGTASNDFCVDNPEIGTTSFEKSDQVSAASPNDSGIENDSTYVHSAIALCLNKVSGTLIELYKFITSFVDEVLSRRINDKRKNILHDQARKLFEMIIIVIQKLRNIKKRESEPDTILKKLLLRAGVEATTDKRITRYSSLVKKLLEQALTFRKALKTIVKVTLGDYEAMSSGAETINSSIRYLNIFE
ncbi:putative uncharacterized protein DDB_G0282133 [Helicoverpa zea]|uniref:putative uncharacterized protein DDB_G0282133 n=1 Tax=Helicoverpa zea TaxID=7113 RepID=UPI001F578E55|nr:putative uncharacterized protein DDB_G0282133 [Helicoverpa zea]